MTLNAELNARAELAAQAEPNAQAELMIVAPASRVWAALTTPATLKKCFFGADIVTDWIPGSTIRMRGVFKGKRYEDKGHILVFEPQKCLGFSLWSELSRKPDAPANYRMVRFDLIAQGATTKVVLSQANLTGGKTQSDIEHRVGHENGQLLQLAALARIVE